MSEQTLFDKKLVCYTSKYFGGTPMYKLFLDAERKKIPQQNATIIPFIKLYLQKDVRKLRVLDYGCGTGGATVAWALQGAKTYGTEIGAEDLELARLRARAHRVKPTFIKVSSTRIPFKNVSFDLVVCDQVLEHIPDYEKALKELWRVAKKGPILYVDVPNKYYPLEPHYNLLFAHWLPNACAAHT